MGDRFYYENGHDTNTSFSLEQLNEIRTKSSMSSLLCTNLDLLNQVQKKAFEPINTDINPLVKCTSINKLDLTLWQTEKLTSS